MICIWMIASVVINEVRYDPPGPDTGGEYVELLNSSDTPVRVDAAWRLDRGNGARADDWVTVWTGDGTVLGPGDRLVIGDDPRVDRPASLSLQNGPDACRLVRDQKPVDRVGWGKQAFPEYAEGAAADDPTSGHIVRWPDGTDTDSNVRDFREALIETIGATNSPTEFLTVGFRWPATEPAHPVAGQPVTLRLHIVNAGLESVPAGDSGVSAEVGDTEWSRHHFSRDVVSGAARDVEFTMPGLPLGSHRLTVDPLSAGAGVSIVVHAGESPIVINEILADPAEGEPEWVELRIRGGDDGLGWRLRDLSGSDVELPALDDRDYVVITTDRAALLDRRPMDADVVIELTGMVSLNDADELLALIDTDGAVRDAVAFTARQGESLERVQPTVFGDDPAAFAWSSAPSPGSANTVDQSTVTDGTFDVTPRVLGSEPMRLSFDLGDGKRIGIVQIVLFDARGVRRGNVYRHEPSAGRGVFVWRGTLDGVRVTPGLYVLRAEFTAGGAVLATERRSIAVSWEGS